MLRAGNFSGDNNVFGGAGPTGLSTLETAFQEGETPNQLTLDKLFYSFPIGSHLTVTTGPRVGQEDMLAIWPSFYPSGCCSRCSNPEWCTSRVQQKPGRWSRHPLG